MKDDILNDYFIAVYDLQDNYIYSFDDIKTLSTIFNLSLKEILLKIKNNLVINKEFKFYLYKKPKFERKRKNVRS